MESERERIGDLRRREAILLVKMMLEEVRFKASFEGREGRAVAESERKRIPDLCSSRRSWRHHHHAVFF